MKVISWAIGHIKRLLKFLFITSLKLTVLVAVFIIIFVVLGHWLNHNDQLQSADAIVVVSGGDTKARAKTGIDLYKAGWSNLLIFSGAAADPNSKSNAEVMRKQALDASVPAESIIIDDKSSNTSENAREVAKQVQELKLSRVILVTSGYHIRRASAELQAATPNLQIIDRTSSDSNWSPDTWWVTPYGWWVTGGEVAKLITVKLR